MDSARDRSPFRRSRTPLENGDGDSSSSRSSDSAAIPLSLSKSSSRHKEELANGEREKFREKHSSSSLSDPAKALQSHAPSPHSMRYVTFSASPYQLIF